MSRRTRPGPRALPAWVVLFAALALSACGTAPATRYYLLAPPAMDGVTGEKTDGLRLGVETFVVDPP
ncbi:MAG: hypothetical protein AAFX50_26075, partial [Acidobacteriota bacterium]